MVSRADSLADRQEEILRRIDRLAGASADSLRLSLLKDRQERLLASISALETSDVLDKAADAPKDSQCPPSEVQSRLTSVLVQDGVKTFRFVRAPADYYSQSLEYRMGILNAASVDHLCKSIVMQNTRAPPDVVDCKDPTLSKYYMIFVQYTARLHADKLHSFIRDLAASGGHKLSKQKINMRLVPEDVNTMLTGFQHNAVAPVGCSTKIPIIVSHRIANLQPNFFWLGGGEVDLKLGLDWTEFFNTYSPYVVDCTYD